MKEPLTFLFLGKSGAGKGTQAELLIKSLGERTPWSENEILSIETGARFRSFIEGESYSSKRAKELYDRGGLMPSNLAIWNWTNIFIEKLTGNEHIIMDGICRRLTEAVVMDDALRFYGRSNTTHIIYLAISDEVATERLLNRARFDDKDEKIITRLAWFKSEVLPVLHHFQSAGEYHFHEIDGEQSMEDVHEVILSKINDQA
jgi:adenylate kinase family enzyme